MRPGAPRDGTGAPRRERAGTGSRRGLLRQVTSPHLGAGVRTAHRRGYAATITVGASGTPARSPRRHLRLPTTEVPLARIAILHPGEMGAAVGRCLADTGHDVVWLPQGRSRATSHRADTAELRPVDNLRGCDVVVSLCPPAEARGVAAAVSASGDFHGVYVDANALSPTTAAEVASIVEGAGATYVDGSVIGPPPSSPGVARLYLSGEQAPIIAALFEGARLDARVLDADRFAASAIKMSYASWTKISAALVLTARETAHRLGVETALLEEWSLSQPQLGQVYDGALTSARAKGWRWDDEMRQIAATCAAVGLPAGFGQAAAETFAAFPRPSLDAPDSP